MKKVLVVEPSTSERQDWRRLLKKFPKQIDFDFAWSAKRKAVWTADEIKDKINENEYDYMFLCPAWTKKEQNLLNVARRQPIEWLEENVGDLIDNLSGFTLLESIVDEIGCPPIPVSVAIDAFSYNFAHFLTTRWRVSAFSKWGDRVYINAFIARIMRTE